MAKHFSWISMIFAWDERHFSWDQRLFEFSHVYELSIGDFELFDPSRFRPTQLVAAGYCWTLCGAGQVAGNLWHFDIFFNQVDV